MRLPEKRVSGERVRGRGEDWIERPRGAAVGIAIRFLLGLGFVAVLWLSGCGTPGAPQPPSLRLPEPVADLGAARNGSVVTLHWTMPKKTTDHLLLSTQIRGPIPVRICRREGATSACLPAGQASVLPGDDGEFHETLPAALATGDPRPLFYFVELRNTPGPSGRSAGLSNSAVVPAGTPPLPVVGLTAEVRADGVALHWTNRSATMTSAVRLHRRLLNPDPPEKKSEGKSADLSSAPPEAVLRDLLVETPIAGNKTTLRSGAVDSSVHFGKAYEYTVQPLERVILDGKAFELAGEISASVRVDVIDTFPPAVPQGLVAVLVPEQNTIDLSWQPDTEEDLAGYIVYRTGGEEARAWKRISGSVPIAGPAYRDSSIEPGRSYRYAVSAIDLTGHESKRSAEAQETVPNP